MAQAGMPVTYQFERTRICLNVGRIPAPFASYPDAYPAPAYTVGRRLSVRIRHRYRLGLGLRLARALPLQCRARTCRHEVGQPTRDLARIH